MRKTTELMLTAGIAATFALAPTAYAEPRWEDHDDHRHDQGMGGLACEQPSWVMVFSLGRDGRLLPQTQGRTGVFVTSELSDEGLFARMNYGRQTPDCEWQIVVRSERPFAMRHGFRCDDEFRLDGRGQLRREHARRLCRLLGVRPKDVQITVYPVRVHRERNCRYCEIGFSSQLWAGISSGGGVYVDGGFRGRGFEVLARLAPGRHRVTVVTDSGHKYSDWVAFPLPSNHFEPMGMESCRLHP